MNKFLKERTVNGKVWSIHDVIPYVGSYCADWGMGLNPPEVDWFPSSNNEDWKMVVDWTEFGDNWPEDFDNWSENQQDEFREALAKDYVGCEEPLTTKPDPDFWNKIIAEHGSSNLLKETFGKQKAERIIFFRKVNEVNR